MTPNTGTLGSSNAHLRDERTDTFSSMLATELDPDEVANGVWHDDLLTLGGRLRSCFGNMVTLDKSLPGYLVHGADERPVTVTCPLEATLADNVRMACLVAPVLSGTPGLWQFLLRENARLKFVRLSFDDGVVWADYQLPFRAACGPFLETGILAVANAARSLRSELWSIEKPER
jgi:hypothetical protein